MCRLIFLLLLMANIVPLFVEGGKCYDDPGPADGYDERECGPSGACYSVKCKDGYAYGYEDPRGCGTCKERFGTDEHDGCKCIDCIGDLCNTGMDEGSRMQCYDGPHANDEYKFCFTDEKDGCFSLECGPDAGPGLGNYKGCGSKCPIAGPGCECLPCIGNLCNKPKEKVIGNGKCYKALDEFADPKVTDCPSEACFSVQCSDSSGSNINQCYGHQNNRGKYETVNCTFLNNDGCHTKYCDDGSDKKSCGKCPPPEELDGCKCVECTEGDMCNKPVTVNQCYWGDDQKGYEAMDCKADGHNNKGCQKISCLNRVNKGIRINSTVYRDCGKCRNVPDPDKCKCFYCNDGDLCNASGRIGSSSFVVVLVIFGGVVVFLAMKPLVGNGI